jgi:hypothetical protein
VLITYCIDHRICQQRAQSAELLARRISGRTPGTHVEAREVPLSLEERLRAARDLIDQELDDLATLRDDINLFSDAVLEHMLVLRNIKDNFLRW